MEPEITSQTGHRHQRAAVNPTRLLLRINPLSAQLERFRELLADRHVSQIRRRIAFCEQHKVLRRFANQLTSRVPLPSVVCKRLDATPESCEPLATPRRPPAPHPAYRPALQADTPFLCRGRRGAGVMRNTCRFITVGSAAAIASTGTARHDASGSAQEFTQRDPLRLARLPIHEHDYVRVLQQCRVKGGLLWRCHAIDGPLVP